jgi:type III secretion protein J
MALVLRLAAIVGLLVLAGCREDLYSQLSEGEANQMLAVLRANGLSAEKISKGAKDGFSISVDDSDMLRAIAVLNNAGFPKNTHGSIAKVFEKSGIMSSPFEERVRYTYALAEELSRTLTQIDGVVTARVHIVLPEAPQIGQPLKPSSAAVFIKHQPGVDLDYFAPQIRRLVSSSVEGLDYSAVTVVLSEATAIKPNMAPLNEAEETVEVLPGLWIKRISMRLFWLIAASAGALIVILIAATIVAFTARRNRKAAPPSPETALAMMVEPS